MSFSEVAEAASNAGKSVENKGRSNAKIALTSGETKDNSVGAGGVKDAGD